MFDKFGDFCGLHEECGIFGIYSPDENVAHDTYCALMALQHRGQESCGIAVNNDRKISFHKDSGLVSEVFNQHNLSTLNGTMAIGHVRYSTAGGSGRENAQPLVLRYVKGNLAIAHNGNLVNADELRKKFEETGAIYQTNADSEIIAYAIARKRLVTNSIEDAVREAVKELKGAFSLVIMSPKKLIACRDPWGFRPLCMGRRGNSVVFASETCALDSIDATFERDIEPGEIVVVENGSVRSIKSDTQNEEHICIFEYIYFARPDSVVCGQSISRSRQLAGAFLAKQHPVDADIVIGVPDSGISAAMGYAIESGIPYGEGFVKNRYIGRTFISPTQAVREQAVKLKLNPLIPYIKDKRVVMVDDSIVRGTTTRRIVTALREAGAKEVHVRVSSPPFLWPCFYGTDIPSKDELIADKHTVEETRALIDADSLGYLALDSLRNIIPDGPKTFCSACFNGDYPVLED